MKKLSFVIPCYNSSLTVPGVISEIGRTVAERSGVEYEIVAIVDGSPDDVFSILKDIAATDSHIKIIELAKNFGQANALMAGYNYTSGDIIVTLDDDGQCPLDHLWDLIQPVATGEADMSVARYPEKKAKSSKKRR